MYPHSAHHRCGESCSFSWTTGFPVCKHSGLRHRCREGVCLDTDRREGHLVCTWTGLVMHGCGSNIDRTYKNNVSRSLLGDCEPCMYGVQALGYALKTSKVKQKRATWGTKSNSSQAQIAQRCIENRKPELQPRKKQRFANGGRKAPELVKGAQARVVPPPLNNGMLDNRTSRNRNIATYMVWSLFMDAPTRTALRDAVLQRRANAWKSEIRKRSLAKKPYMSAVCCIRDYAEVCRKNPLPVDIYDKNNRDDNELAVKDIQPETALSTILRRVKSGSLHRDLTETAATFIMTAWSNLCQTHMWSKNQPDFYSFVMGLIYICKDKGIKVGDTLVIPDVKLFQIHAPFTNSLTQLCNLQGVRDCRSAPFGRARITDGMNAIRSTLLYEHQNGGKALSRLTLLVPPKLQLEYGSVEHNSPWFLDNLPKFDL